MANDIKVVYTLYIGYSAYLDKLTNTYHILSAVLFLSIASAKPTINLCEKPRNMEFAPDDVWITLLPTYDQQSQFCCAAKCPS